MHHQEWTAAKMVVVGSNTLQSKLPALHCCPLLPISPAMDIMGVAAELHSRGHDVVVVVTEPALSFVKSAAARHTSNTTAEGLTYVVVNITFREFEAPKPLKFGEVPPPSRFATPGTWPQSMLFRLTAGADMLQLFQPGVAGIAGQLLGNSTLMQRLRDFKADAWMSVGLSLGGLVSDNTGCIMSHALDVQLVDVSGNAFFSGPPSVPQFGTGLTPADLNTLPGLALNYGTWLLTQARRLSSGLTASATNQLRQQYGLPWAASSCAAVQAVRKLRGISTRACKPCVEVIMGTWLVEWPRALQPYQVLAGPGTARPAHHISPPDVKEFVDTAAAGVVLAAFGTVYGSTLRPEDAIELALGFAQLAPTRVLWAVKASALPPGLTFADLPLGTNTRVVPWVDYNDVLGHPNTVAFVSHAGMHSVNEAAFHGIPFVALPFQMEQAENALKIAARGAAALCMEAPAFRRGSKRLLAQTYTAAGVTGVIKKVLDDPSYAQAAQAIGRALQEYAVRRHPYQRAADQIEFAINTAHTNTARC